MQNNQLKQLDHYMATEVWRQAGKLRESLEDNLAYMLLITQPYRDQKDGQKIAEIRAALEII